MNKQYIVNEDNRVSVVTDNGDVIERVEEYTDNTKEILSLENYQEQLENKVNFLNNRLNERNNALRKKKKDIKNINRLLLLLLCLLGFITLAIPNNLCLGLLISFIPMGMVIKFLENSFIKREEKKKDTLSSDINTRKEQLEKVKRKIESLSKDKSLKGVVEHNTFIEVEPLYNYNFDVKDYFMEKYLIDKRTKEMTGEVKTKVKKMPSRLYSNRYDI